MAIGIAQSLGSRTDKEKAHHWNAKISDGQNIKGSGTMHVKAQTVNVKRTPEFVELGPGKTFAECEREYREQAQRHTPPLPQPDTTPTWADNIQAGADVQAELQSRQQSAPALQREKAQQQQGQQSAPEEPQGRLKPFTTDEIKNAPLPNFIIQGIIAEQTLTLIYGDSASGKTFFTLDMIARILEGMDWQSCQIVFKPTSVIYFCLEGFSNLGKRVKAWECYNGRTFPNVTWYQDLVFTQDIAELKALCPEGALIVIDTLGACSTGLNINDAKDMLLVTNKLYEIIKEKKATVLMVHHTGKNAEREAAGSFVLKSNVNNQIKIEKMNSSSARLVKCMKLKDGEEGLEFQFTLYSDIDLGVDENGYDITSCAVKHDGRYLAGRNTSGTTKTSRPPKEDSTKGRALKALKAALQEGKTDALPIDPILQNYLKILPENAVSKCSKREHYNNLFRALKNLPNVVINAVQRVNMYSINNDLS